MKKIKKVPSQLDVDITLLLKENRVGTKTFKLPNTLSNNDIYNSIIDKILQLNNCIENDINEVFIIDKCYDYDDLKFLYSETNYIFIINDSDIYKRLRESNDIIITNIELYFFDDILKLTRFTSGS